MREEQFKEWLSKQVPITLHKDSPKNYVSYISSVENKIGTLDYIDILLLDETLEKITPETFYELAPLTLKKFKSAVKKYWEFRNETRMV